MAKRPGMIRRLRWAPAWRWREGRPLRRRMMAAMAQQDCGQCGYNCHDYAEAIASRKEARLNLCAPGGKDTARMLKTLAEELDKGARQRHPAVRRRAVGRRAIDRCRRPVVRATIRRKPVFLSRRRLNKEGSEKETWHVEFDLTPSGLDYTPGDSFGVFAKNELGLVDQIIAMLGASHITEVRGKTLREVLQSDVSLGSAPDALFDLISFLTGGEKREKARRLAHGEDPDGDAATLDVLAVLQKFSGVRPHPEAFVEALEPLQPRLYSISSSPKAAPGKLSLTVDAVRYVDRQAQAARRRVDLPRRTHRGGETLPVYVQAAHNFALPRRIPKRRSSWLAPARASRRSAPFLQERGALRAPRQKLAVLWSSASGRMISFTPTNSTR